MSPTTWYLLIHQLPVRPLYFRARIRRLLADAGAVPLKKAVYALPAAPESLERLARIADEVRSGGGEAFVCLSTFIRERDAAALVQASRKARAADYARVVREARMLKPDGERSKSRVARLRERLERIRAMDHGSPSGEREARAALDQLERRMRPRGRRGAAAGTAPLVGRTWVTRRGLHVDRLACAWLVRRHIDPDARFRFADAANLRATPDELTFDVPGARFAHEQGRCSVETLLLAAGIDDPAARRIAEIVHDIDIKDGRFGHAETAGVERLIAGIVANHDDDRDRLERGLTLFDDLHRSFQKEKRVTLRLERTPRPPRPPGRRPGGRT